MATIKIWGCGGRYSFVQFVPCYLCLATDNKEECHRILKNNRTELHQEWWTVR